MIVSRAVTFDAAHLLPYYEGKCKNLHGHTWKVEVAVEGRIMEEHGLVVDFSRLKQWMEDNIVMEYDHTYLNDKMDNPTAENIALAIKEMFGATGWSISGDIKLAWIRVWEGLGGSYVEEKG